jgi:RNA polymerase sigma-70 factor (ECF subfamily)
MSTDASGAPPSDAVARDHFVTTRWTMVVSAGRKSSPHSERALAELCRAYWYPLYVYVRRQGHSKEDAEDTVQAFFARLLAGGDLAGLSAERGRFRAFLLASTKHFLANEWNRANRQKRGGGSEHLSLDWTGADDRFRLDPADPAATPDASFDRAWALALLERVVGRLGDEMGAEGKGALFGVGRGFLAMDRDAVPYGEAARGLGMEEGALRVAVHRMRKRYRALLRDEIGQTLADPAWVDEELRSLQAALAG